VMRVDMLASLVPFASQGDVEQIIVDAIKHSYLQVCSHLARVHGPVRQAASAAATSIRSPAVR